MRFSFYQHANSDLKVRTFYKNNFFLRKCLVSLWVVKGELLDARIIRLEASTSLVQCTA